MNGYDAPTIEIYCDDSYHETKPAVVARFAKTTQGWELLSQWRHADVDGVSPRIRRQRNDIAVQIDGCVRYNLTCGCGVTVPIRNKRLQPILGHLHAAGLSSLSLTALSTRLRRNGAR